MAELKNLIVEGDTRLIGDTNAGKITATSIVKSGGTSSQFLKADGSVDSNTYATQTWVNNKGYTANTGTVTSVAAGTGLAISGTATVTPTVGVASGYTLPTTTAFNAKAPLASPALTGTPTAPTAAAGTNTTQIATTAFVKGEQAFVKGTGATSSAVLKNASDTASGTYSTAEGSNTTASGHSTHAEGIYTTAQNQAEHSQGQYNVSHKANTTFGNAGNTIHSIGIGTGSSYKKNAIEVMQNGDVYVYGVGGYTGANYSSAKTLQQALPYIIEADYNDLGDGAWGLKPTLISDIFAGRCLGLMVWNEPDADGDFYTFGHVDMNNGEIQFYYRYFNGGDIVSRKILMNTHGDILEYSQNTTPGERDWTEHPAGGGGGEEVEEEFIEEIPEPIEDLPEEIVEELYEEIVEEVPLEPEEQEEQ